MVQETIFVPMCVLVFWTLLVLTLVPIVRIRAAMSGRVEAGDFKYGESGKVPGDVSLPNRDYMNLLELPVLFYVACLTIYATRQVDETYVMLAWGFVAGRAVHSLVHLTTNNVLHRLAVFAAALVFLLVMWVRFAMGLM